jgi:hypothetical protein
MKTAIEWFAQQVNSSKWKFADKTDREAIIQQAKQMEKGQIIESYCQGCFDISKDENIFPRETSEQYYNETFKSE